MRALLVLWPFSERSADDVLQPGRSKALAPLEEADLRL